MNSATSRIGFAAMMTAGVMVSYQTAGKAARDAVFLAHYQVSQLPAMVIAAAVATMALSYFSLRWIARFGPSLLVSRTFLISAVLQLAEWAVLPLYPRIVAPLVYLHIAALTAILASGFWSILSEEIQLREAKHLFARIATWGTAGGILGGLVAERMGAWFGTDSVLLQLGLSHLVCAALLWRHVPASRPAAVVDVPQDLSPWESFSRVPYLATLALMVLLGTSSAAALDFLFKAQAREVFGSGPELLRFLAIFHTSTQVLTIFVQWLVARVAVEKLNLTMLTGSVPAVVGAGSLLSTVFLGFPVIAVTRLLEASTRVAMFRNGYELFYTPIPAKEKRSVKTFIDVVCDRLGDAASSVIVQTALVASPASARYVILGFTIIASAVSLRIAARLDKGYRVVVERGLLHRASELDLGYVEDYSSSSAVSLVADSDTSGTYSATGSRIVVPPKRVEADPVLETLKELRSNSADRVNAALRSISQGQLDPVWVPALISLLSWNGVADPVRRILAEKGFRFTGLLVDYLTNPATDIVISRRIPRIIAAYPSQRACDGLVQGLADDRFEVRFQCGRALDSLRRKLPSLRIDAETIYEAVLREVSVNKNVWDSHRLLEERDAQDEFSFLDDVLRERAHQSLEHVFSLLALVLPREPVRTAFRAMHSGDRALCDLALEYLESNVPAHVRATLWPVLEGRPSQISEGARTLAARDLLLTERGLLVALQRIDEADGIS